MRRLTLLLLVTLLVAAAAGAAYMFVGQPADRADAPAASRKDTVGATPTTRVAATAARDALLATPQQVDLLLAVDLPKGAGLDNPDHQEIMGSGQIDYSEGDADLVYNFGELTNAAGHLGDFESLDVIYVDRTGYLKIFVSGPPWLRIQPDDAANGHVLRLREVMLTTPMILPGLLDVAASADGVSGAAVPQQIDVASLVDADDNITSGIASALQKVGAQEITFDLTVDEDGDAQMALAFSYPDTAGQTDVQVTYRITSTDEQVSVDVPNPSRVRTFSSIFD